MVVVESGDTPYGIARALTKNGARWRELATAQDDPKTRANLSRGILYQGQQLKIPGVWIDDAWTGPAGPSTGSMGVVQAKQGQRYRARLLLTGLASFGSEDQVKSKMGELGFSNIVAYNPSSLPADWPADQRENKTGTTTTTWFLEATWSKPDQVIDTNQSSSVQLLWLAPYGAAPAQPAQPGQPAQPAQPAQPTQPTQPTQPAGVYPQNKGDYRYERDQWAREIIKKAMQVWFPGQTPTQRQMDIVQATCLAESGYGRGWGKYPDGMDSHNWGAVQSPKKPIDGACPPGYFCAQDTIPQSDGTSIPYLACFRKYPDDVQGAADVVYWLTTKKAPLIARAIAQNGTLEDVCAAFYDSRYYQGTGKTREARIQGRANGFAQHLARFSKTLGEPIVFERGPVPPPGQMGGSSSGTTNTGSAAAAVGIALAVGVGAALVLGKHR